MNSTLCAQPYYCQTVETHSCVSASCQVFAIGDFIRQSCLLRRKNASLQVFVELTLTYIGSLANKLMFIGQRTYVPQMINPCPHVSKGKSQSTLGSPGKYPWVIRQRPKGSFSLHIPSCLKAFHGQNISSSVSSLTHRSSSGTTLASEIIKTSIVTKR